MGGERLSLGILLSCPGEVPEVPASRGDEEKDGGD